jgi:glutamyl-tRNA synthetase
MTQTPEHVCVRFAPSPTGRTHIGNARTALYNFLLARQTGGQFILRIEDTDRRRFDPAAEGELIESLHWLGIEWDQGPDVGGPHAPYRQSSRKEIYQKYAGELVRTGHAYPCFCSPQRLDELRREQQRLKEPPQYDGLCRRIAPEEAAERVAAGEPHVIRFSMPREGSITVHDWLRGDITYENKNLDDYILVKSDGLALYHLAAMVDDHLMGITHVIRTSEWLPTFPLHVHIYRALGWDQPHWIHPSIFLKPSGKGKMSKRDARQYAEEGHSIFLRDLRDLGYIPEAVDNWIALMGWSYDDHTEFFTLEDLIEKFSLDRLNPAPAAINFSKLDHFNGLHIRTLDQADLAERVSPFFEKAGYDPDPKTLRAIAPLIRERLVTLEDAPQIFGFFFSDEIQPEGEELVGKKMTAGQAQVALERSRALVGELPDLHPDTLEPPFRALAEELGLKAGQLFGVVRVAVTGQKVSPPLFETMAVIGRGRVLERLDRAQSILADAGLR